MSSRMALRRSCFNTFTRDPGAACSVLVGQFRQATSLDHRWFGSLLLFHDLAGADVDDVPPIGIEFTAQQSCQRALDGVEVVDHVTPAASRIKVRAAERQEWLLKHKGDFGGGHWQFSVSGQRGIRMGTAP
jgi:hypothetical protein